MMEKKLVSGIFLISIILFLGFFASENNKITGFVLYEEKYEEKINVLNWTFDDVNDYTYDASLLNLSNGEGMLRISVVENTWSVENLTEILVISASEYEPGKKIHDRTGKIQSLDGEDVNINKDKDIFDITFDDDLSNNDVISLYILESGNNNVNVYLCDNGTFCDSSNYGSINFNGDEGWYNITITGLSETKDFFNIDPTENTKFDYIKATHRDTATFTSTNTSYPESASIETNDVSITELSSFLNFHKNDLPNGQNIIYKYSTDSGTTWAIIPSNNNLSEVSVSSNKIRIKADLSGDGIGTPTIYDFAVSYSTQVCTENWNITYGACTSDNTQLRYYLDKNECGTENNLPNDNGTLDSCVYIQPKDNTIQNKSKLLIDARVDSNVLFEADTKSSISADSISIVEYSSNSKSSLPNLKELRKYIDINTDNKTKNNLSSISIRIYYTDEEITDAGLEEDTIKIHYFNETSDQWQELNSTVNTTGNYVEVIIDHLSTFGIFGEESEIEESSSSEDEGSGGDSEENIENTTTVSTISKSNGAEVKTEDQEDTEEETVDVLAPNEIVKEDLEVDLVPLEFQTEKIETNFKIPIFIVIFLLIAVISILIYLKFFRKKNEKLT